MTEEPLKDVSHRPRYIIKRKLSAKSAASF